MASLTGALPTRAASRFHGRALLGGPSVLAWAELPQEAFVPWASQEAREQASRIPRPIAPSQPFEPDESPRASSWRPAQGAELLVWAPAELGRWPHQNPTCRPETPNYSSCRYVRYCRFRYYFRSDYFRPCYLRSYNDAFRRMCAEKARRRLAQRRKRPPQWPKPRL
jgi:hypothetical protein